MTTSLEVASLAECEQVIERGLATFVEVGQALMRIRDGKLYRREHPTFEAYCEHRWGFTRQRANQLIAGAEVVRAVTTAVVNEAAPPPPVAERQARELAPLLDQPEELVEVWQGAVERTGGMPTAEKVREVRTEHEYARAVEEFPELAPEASPSLPPAEAVKVANDLRAVPEGPEREKRRVAAATWHRAAGSSRAGADPFGAADSLISALSVARRKLESMGGAERLSAGVASAHDRLAIDAWAAEIDAALELLTALRAACRPDLRRVQ